MLLPTPSVGPPSSIATSSCQCFVRRGEEESSHCVSPSLFNDLPSPQLPYSMVYVGEREREREGRRNTVEHARGLFCGGYSDSGEGNANRIYLRNTRLGEGKRRNIPTAVVQKPRRGIGPKNLSSIPSPPLSSSSPNSGFACEGSSEGKRGGGRKERFESEIRFPRHSLSPIRKKELLAIKRVGPSV